MKIAVVGCLHGALDVVYDMIKKIEKEQSIKIDLLIVAGDFQSLRNKKDMKCMACPLKYLQIGEFHPYYSQTKKAHVLTLFIGGNHEASNFLQELPYGGWVAPNIYYMGFCSSVMFGGLRIVGVSGIYQHRDYHRGYYEKLPYDVNSIRTIYHVRQQSVFRLKQLKKQKVDILFSHDWPTGVTKFGDEATLLKFKPYFFEDIQTNKLGSPANADLMQTLQPEYYFAAHLHCKFTAKVKFESGNETKFLALSKPLPGKSNWFQIMDIPSPESTSPPTLELDPYWLCILKSTDHLISMSNATVDLPGFGGSAQYEFYPTEDELREVRTDFDYDFEIPTDFEMTGTAYDLNEVVTRQPGELCENPQTARLCAMLDIKDLRKDGYGAKYQNQLANFSGGDDDVVVEKEIPGPQNANPDEICLDDEDSDEGEEE